MNEPVKNEQGCWYKHHISECPVCGKGDWIRERQPAPKPEDPRERWEFEQVYDWCNVL